MIETADWKTYRVCYNLIVKSYFENNYPVGHADYEMRRVLLFGG